MAVSGHDEERAGQAPEAGADSGEESKTAGDTSSETVWNVQVRGRASDADRVGESPDRCTEAVF